MPCFVRGIFFDTCNSMMETLYLLKSSAKVRYFEKSLAQYRKWQA